MASTSQDFTSGQVLTAAEMDQLPQGILDIQRNTAGLGPTSGTTELTLLTSSALTPAQTGRRWRIVFQCRGLQGSIANDTYTLRIKEGATVLNDFAWNPIVGGGSTTFGLRFEAIVDSPTVASHTYSCTIVRSTGTGTATLTATATAPILFYVEDAGSA